MCCLKLNFFHISCVNLGDRVHAHTSLDKLLLMNYEHWQSLNQLKVMDFKNQITISILILILFNLQFLEVKKNESLYNLQ